MYTRIEFIGLFDNQGNRHGVKLNPGLNLITGRSATGKSSIIEIYDYCMGETRNTIPTGVISDVADIYFLYLYIGLKKWILGRDSKTHHYLIDADANEIKTIDDITIKVFEKATSLTGAEYKTKLSLLYGLDLQSTATSEEEKQRGGMVGAPSIRNTMSFILQHQNLVANKLAFFYRFEEKEKREQTIDQFKIFSKYVDARYFSLSLEISKLKKKIEKLTKYIDKEKDAIERRASDLENVHEEYKVLTGKNAIPFFSVQAILSSPAKYNEDLGNVEIEDIGVDEENQQYADKYDKLNASKNHLLAEIRRLQLKRSEINSTIENLKEYKNRLLLYKTPKDIHLDYSICPFCHQHTDVVEKEASRLTDAIVRLNNELLTINPLIKPQYEELTEVEELLTSKMAEMRMINVEIEKLHSIITQLRNNKSLKTQAYKLIVKMQGMIESIIDLQRNLHEEELEQLSSKLREMEGDLKAHYDVDKKINKAGSDINKYIKDYRKYLRFEERFDQYELKFNIKNFELAFENNIEKIPMRSVGSGSNWLNAHLCLFLALSSYFNNTVDSAVPSVLFLDQPSQVYFPSKDDKEVFDAEALKKQIGEEKLLDHDMKEVTNIFQTLYDFCISHKNAIQIIVTDHADNLNIDGLDNFETIVVARWRTRDKGLIDRTIINI